jgi:hypothetical protein
MGEDRKVYSVLVGNPERKRPLGRPRRRWEDEIRMDLREIGWESVEWIQLAQDSDRWLAVVNTVMNLRVRFVAPPCSFIHLLSLYPSLIIFFPYCERQDFVPLTDYGLVLRGGILQSVPCAATIF